jgi:hypothetical protein
MQPTYFPWAGYFNLMSKVDVFVFLDDVQYERSSWQNRNRVLVNSEAHWLSVPAQREFLGQTINHVKMDERQNWREKHVRLLSQAYARHPYADEMLQIAQMIKDIDLNCLAELNVKIIADIARAFGINTRLMRSSNLGIAGQRTERLIAICDHLRCDEYLSPTGSSDYLADDGFNTKTSILLSFNNYDPVPYRQWGARDFISHLSVLDVIANLGYEGAASYVMNAGTTG